MKDFIGMLSIVVLFPLWFPIAVLIWSIALAMVAAYEFSTWLAEDDIYQRYRKYMR